MSKRKLISFNFMEGYVPIDREYYVPWPEFEKKFANKNIILSSAPRGIEVNFMTKSNIDSNGALVWFTDEFMLEDPEGLFSLYLHLLDECKTK